MVVDIASSGRKSTRISRISRADKGARNDVGAKGNSDTSGNWSTGICDPQNGRVAPAESWHNI